MTARPLDSGRKDSLGRTVKVAADAGESRADAPAPDDAEVDYRMSGDDLAGWGLPRGIDAYPHYPEGVHIPAGEVGNVVVTDDAEAGPSHVRVGVYDADMSENVSLVEVPKDKLEATVAQVMFAARTDDPGWLVAAGRRLDELDTSGPSDAGHGFGDEWDRIGDAARSAVAKFESMSGWRVTGTDFTGAGSTPTRIHVVAPDRDEHIVYVAEDGEVDWESDAVAEIADMDEFREMVLPIRDAGYRNGSFGMERLRLH